MASPSDKLWTTPLEPERDAGNLEYKRQLLPSTPELEEKRLTQLMFRLAEGRGEAYYILGVDDDGQLVGLEPDVMEESVAYLQRLTDRAGAHLTLVRRGAIEEEGGLVAEYLIRQLSDEMPLAIHVGVIGNVDSGKSSLTGVLTTGQADDGRGSARSGVLRHKHEVISGRTSAVSNRLVGYDQHGDAVVSGRLHVPSWPEILERSDKVVVLTDLAGHERYLKTTIFGLTSQTPEYAVLIIAANQGVLPMTKEHLGLVLALKIPLFCVVTKIDLAPETIKERTVRDLKKLLKMPGIAKLPFTVTGRDDAVVASQSIGGGKVVPIFELSNVTMEGIEDLHQFLNLLPIRDHFEDRLDEPFLGYIDEIYSVSGVGTVVATRVLEGEVSEGGTVLLGPMDSGQFRPVRVRSIYAMDTPVRRARAGQLATLALHQVSRDQVRKGMVVAAADREPTAVTRFSGEVMLLYHSTTIKVGYTPVIHSRGVRAAASITRMDQEVLRTGMQARVRFRFAYKPEYLRPGDRFIFREGKTKGIGIVTEVE